MLALTTFLPMCGRASSQNMSLATHSNKVLKNMFPIGKAVDIERGMAFG